MTSSTQLVPFCVTGHIYIIVPGSGLVDAMAAAYYLNIYWLYLSCIRHCEGPISQPVTKIGIKCIYAKLVAAWLLQDNQAFIVRQLLR